MSEKSVAATGNGVLRAVQGTGLRGGWRTGSSSCAGEGTPGRWGRKRCVGVGVSCMGEGGNVGVAKNQIARRKAGWENEHEGHSEVQEALGGGGGGKGRGYSHH